VGEQSRQHGCRHANGPAQTAADFWKEYDARQAAGKSPEWDEWARAMRTQESIHFAGGGASFVGARKSGREFNGRECEFLPPSLDELSVARHVFSVTLGETITSDHWTRVHDLIRDIEREERRPAFAAQLAQWDLGVREFRKVELERMIKGDPTEIDFRFHAICLHSLLAMGHFLILRSEEFEKKELEPKRLDRGQIEAYVEELEQSFREWHHGFEDAEIKAAQAIIFGGET
jgi:hypothetical protein